MSPVAGDLSSIDARFWILGKWAWLLGMAAVGILLLRRYLTSNDSDTRAHFTRALAIQVGAWLAVELSLAGVLQVRALGGNRAGTGA